MKRFTDADKWSDPWFRKLSWQAKLAYLYILDNCDAAGVWEPDWAAANFQIGSRIHWEDCLHEIGDRIVWIGDARLRVVKFIRFQYGKLSKECRPHEKIFEAMERNGMKADDLDFNPPCGDKTPVYTLPARVPATLQEEEEEEEKEEEAQMPGWLASAWKEWLEARKQAKRKPYTEMGAKKQLAALLGIGPARAVAAIEYSIRQGYQGIYEDKSAPMPQGYRAHEPLAKPPLREPKGWREWLVKNRSDSPLIQEPSWEAIERTSQDYIVREMGAAQPPTDLPFSPIVK